MATIRREGEMNLRDLYKIYTKEQGGILSYNKYKEVVESFMKEMMNKIIKTGWEFSMPHHCGLIKVVQLERVFSITDTGVIKGAIDWHSSNKLKAEMIERGELPLEVFKNELGVRTGDNGGSPWLCYFTSKTYFSWIWTAHINMRNCLRYKFDVTWTNSQLLSKSINEDSYLLFKLRKRDGSNKDYLRKVLDAASAIKV